MSKESKRRLQESVNRMALKPLRICKSLHFCEFCQCDIRYGQLYRDGGHRARVHDECLKVVSKEINRKEEQSIVKLKRRKL